MDTRLWQSLLAPRPRATRCLGRRLRPFCLWHSLQLSTFAGVEGAPALAWLELHVDICSRGLEPYAPPRRGTLRHWLATARATFYAGRPVALLREIDTFRTYRESYTAGPRYFTTASSRPCKTPWQLFIAARLMRYGGMTKEQALLTPPGEALWLSAALAEANGAEINLISEAEHRALIEAGYDPDNL